MYNLVSLKKARDSLRLETDGNLAEAIQALAVARDQAEKATMKGHFLSLISQRTQKSTHGH